MPHADELLATAPDRAPALATPDTAARPSKKLAVVTCMDCRLDPLPMLGLQVGEAHVLRNAGGLVNDDVLRSLAASQRLLGTEEVLVVMHEGCGLNGASEDDFGAQLVADGPMPAWRLGAFHDLDETVRQSVGRLRESPLLIAHDAIRGFVYDPASGSVREVTA